MGRLFIAALMLLMIGGCTAGKAWNHDQWDYFILTSRMPPPAQEFCGHPDNDPSKMCKGSSAPITTTVPVMIVPPPVFGGGGYYYRGVYLQ